MEEGERTSVRRQTRAAPGGSSRPAPDLRRLALDPPAPAGTRGGAQRPGGFDVVVLYLPNWRRRQLARNPSTVRRPPVPRSPFARFGVVRRLNDVVGKTFVAALTRLWHPSVTIVAFPTR